MEDKKILNSEEMEKVTGGTDQGEMAYYMMYTRCPKCFAHVAHSSMSPKFDAVKIPPDEDNIYCAQCLKNGWLTRIGIKHMFI